MTEILESHEARVLGAALESRGLWLAECARVSPELFETHRQLAEIICDMTAAGVSLDVLAVRDRLAKVDSSIGLADLEAIGEQAPVSAVAMRASVDALHEANKMRGILSLCARLVKNVKAGDLRADDIINAGVLSFADIAARSATDGRPYSKVLAKVMAKISKPGAGSVRTGVRDFDNYIGGLIPGQLCLVGARPSMGKTALALNITREVAAAGGTVAVFSLEMSDEQVVQRILSDMSGASLSKICQQKLGVTELTRVTNAAAQSHNFEILIHEDASQIASVCRQVKYRFGLELVVVDYVQLMESRASSREQEIARISRQLKTIATQLKVPVVALSQLNRNLEARASKRPQLSDLRESGALEQDADIVMLLWRESVYNDDADPAAAELIVAKNRNGPIGSIDLIWRKECARFENLPRKP